MSNHSFNETVVPMLQPDAIHPGATVDRVEPSIGAVSPRRKSPETGFDLGHAAGGSPELLEMLLRRRWRRRRLPH